MDKAQSYTCTQHAIKDRRVCRQIRGRQMMCRGGLVPAQSRAYSSVEAAVLFEGEVARNHSPDVDTEGNHRAGGSVKELSGVGSCSENEC